MKQLKYKLYACSYGSILLYEDGTVEFIPMLSITVNETLAMSELDDLDFDNNEVCEFLDEDIEEFEEDEEIHSTEDVLKKILETPEEDL